MGTRKVLKEKILIQRREIIAAKQDGDFLFKNPQPS
jgi:hypothetical protein